MRATEDVVGRLGRALGLDPTDIACPWVFRAAIDHALACTSVDEIVTAVVGGPCQSVPVGWGAVLSRLRMLPARAARRRQITVERAGDRTRRRAARLASLVAAGLPCDAAEAEIAVAFTDPLDAADALSELRRLVDFASEVLS